MSAIPEEITRAIDDLESVASHRPDCSRAEQKAYIDEHRSILLAAIAKALDEASGAGLYPWHSRGVAGRAAMSDTEKLIAEGRGKAVASRALVQGLLEELNDPWADLIDQLCDALEVSERQVAEGVKIVMRQREEIVELERDRREAEERVVPSHWRQHERAIGFAEAINQAAEICKGYGFELAIRALQTDPERP